jgi:ketosteroid isomerase-like protein
MSEPTATDASTSATIQALEARLTRLEDLMAINQLFIDYGEQVDAGDFHAYAALFAHDGEVLLGPYGRATGRAAIEELVTTQLGAKVGTSFHIISSPRITLNGDTATSTVMWSVAVLADDGLARVSMIGHHIDKLTRTSEGWKIQKRRGTVSLPSLMPPRTNE